MIKLENYEVMGWEHVIRGMRNPMNSWDKSDSDYRAILGSRCDSCPTFAKETWDDCDECEVHIIMKNHHGGFMVGPNDHALMMKLRNAGTDHRKFMRMITVYVDITAPLYWWKEFDTYKVGTVANSCSTMHKIHDKEFTTEDFSCEKLFNEYGRHTTDDCDYLLTFEMIIDCLNDARDQFLETKDKKYWWQMIQLLPSSYNQKRTVMLNYEVLANMYKSRKNHKLDEWRELCQWIESLPYSELITGPALSDIPISDEIMKEAERRVEARYAKQYEAFCAAYGLDQTKEMPVEKHDKCLILGIDLANNPDMTGGAE